MREKRIRKFCFFFLFLLLFTGCTANYEIEIKDGKVQENFEVINKDKTTWNDDVGGTAYSDLVEEYVNYAPPVYEYLIFGGDELTQDEKDALTTYKSRKISSTNELGIGFSYLFNIENYLDSSALNYYSYDLKKEITKDNILKISTGSIRSLFNRYPLLNEINVVLKTNHVVLEHNADKSKQGVFTWNINRDNLKKGTEIVLELDLNETRTYLPDYVTWIILGVAALIVFVFGFWFYNKSLEQNRI